MYYLVFANINSRIILLPLKYIKVVKLAIPSNDLEYKLGRGYLQGVCIWVIPCPRVTLSDFDETVLKCWCSAIIPKML